MISQDASPNLARPMPGQPEPVEELLPAQSGPPPIILISNSLTPSTYVKKRSSRSLFGKTRRRGGGLNPCSIPEPTGLTLDSPRARCSDESSARPLSLSRACEDTPASIHKRASEGAAAVNKADAFSKAAEARLDAAAEATGGLSGGDGIFHVGAPRGGSPARPRTAHGHGTAADGEVGVDKGEGMGSAGTSDGLGGEGGGTRSLDAKAFLLARAYAQRAVEDETDGRVECPHCRRRWHPKVAERHLQVCTFLRTPHRRPPQDGTQTSRFPPAPTASPSLSEPSSASASLGQTRSSSLPSLLQVRRPNQAKRLGGGGMGGVMGGGLSSSGGGSGSGEQGGGSEEVFGGSFAYPGLMHLASRGGLLPPLSKPPPFGRGDKWDPMRILERDRMRMRNVNHRVL